MATTEKTTALAKQGTSGFAIVDDSEAKDVMITAFDQLGISNYQLNRLKIPAGGGSAWEIESLEGTRVEQTLDVIILAVKGKQKSWWPIPVDEGGGGTPPSCASTDGRKGYGNNTLEGGEDAVRDCATCAWNQFGSSRGAGNGKDCKDFSLLFCFLEGSRIPSLLTVPATSLKNLQGYILKLIDAGKRMETVVTSMSIAKAQSGAGITYSTLDLAWKADLDEEAAKGMTGVAKAFSARLVDFDQYADENA